MQTSSSIGLLGLLVRECVTIRSPLCGCCMIIEFSTVCADSCWFPSRVCSFRVSRWWVWLVWSVSTFVPYDVRNGAKGKKGLCERLAQRRSHFRQTLHPSALPPSPSALHVRGPSQPTHAAAHRSTRNKSRTPGHICCLGPALRGPAHSSFAGRGCSHSSDLILPPRCSRRRRRCRTRQAGVRQPLRRYTGAVGGGDRNHQVHRTCPGRAWSHTHHPILPQNVRKAPRTRERQDPRTQQHGSSRSTAAAHISTHSQPTSASADLCCSVLCALSFCVLGVQRCSPG